MSRYSPEEVSRQVGEVMGSVDSLGGMVEGEIYYPLSAAWAASAKAYADKSSALPPAGVIDQSHLADEQQPLALKRGVTEGDDFMWLPASAYAKIKRWYSVTHDFPRRTVLLEDGFTTRVDMFPQVCTTTSTAVAATTQPVVLMLPRRSTAADVLAVVLKQHAAVLLPGAHASNRSNLRVLVNDCQSEDAAAKVLLANDLTFDDVAGDTTVSQVLIEVRAADGSWPSGPIYSPGEAPVALTGGDDSTWRAELRAGSSVDAFDVSRKLWADARVVAVKSAAEAGAADDQLTIHFRGWADRWNAVMPRSAPELAPLYSKTLQWRQALRVGDFVEVRHDEPGSDKASGGVWYAAAVESLDFTVLPAKCTVIYDYVSASVFLPKQQTLSLEDDYKLCALPTHLKTAPAAISKAPPKPAVPSWVHAAASAGTSALVPANRTRIVAGADAGAGMGASVSEVAERFRRHYTQGALGSRIGVPGVCGLDNLGNTCFMNSMMQCMSNTMELTEYFLTNEYVKDVNVDNPLGAGGNLAHAYAALLHAIWSGNFRSVAPDPIKQLVARLAPQFIGWGQQDSKEYMSFFLDLLLEDVCRIVGKKPYIEMKEAGGRPDKEVADETWDGYLRRNSSKVADVFAGQYRSQVECNQCGKTSVTFDPFMSFSVPLPVVKYNRLELYVLASGNARPVQLYFWYADLSSVTVRNLVEWVCTRMGSERWPDAAHAPPGFERFADMKPEEMLVTYYLGASCMPKIVLPHWANLQAAESQFRGRGSNGVHIFMWHMPGVGKLPAPAEGDWEFDYQDIDVTADSDADDDYYQYYSRSKKTFTFKPRPVTDVLGPRPHEFTSVWVRKSTDNATCVAAADSLLVPTVSPTGERLTNRQFVESVWKHLDRLMVLPEGHTYSPEAPPYKLEAFAFLYDKRDLLTHDYKNFKLPGSTAVAYDDEPLRPTRDVQYAVTFHGTGLRALSASEGSGLIKKYVDARAPQSAGGIQLTDCIAKFSVREQLGEADKWYCPMCKDHVRAFKQMTLWRLPPVLIVHLKRFQYERGWASSVLRSKLDDMVDFPTRGLDLKPFLNGPLADGENALYDLYAVSQHSGGLHGGHYTAHAYNTTTRCWYSFNDSCAREARESDAVDSSAYVLFYRRRTDLSEVGEPVRMADDASVDTRLLYQEQELLRKEDRARLREEKKLKAEIAAANTRARKAEAAAAEASAAAVAAAAVAAAAAAAAEEAAAARTCAICTDGEADTLLVPCGHALCAACAARSRTCPFDRRDVASRVKIFWPR